MGIQKQVEAALAGTLVVTLGASAILAWMASRIPIETGESRRAGFYATAAVLAAMSLVTGLVFRRIYAKLAEHLRALADAAHSIEEGLWDFELDTDENVDVAKAGAAFNEMMVGLRTSALTLDRFQFLMNVVTEPVFVLDPDATVTFLNEAAETMHPKAATVRFRSLYSLLPPDHRDLMELSVQDVHENGIVSDLDTTFAFDDDALDFAVSIAPLTQAGGIVVICKPR